MKLINKGLLRNQAYADGHWITADSGATFDVTNPVDQKVITSVPDLGGKETHRAIKAAHIAQPAWAAKTAKDRASLLHSWFQLIMENQEDLAMIMTAEQGKPLREARGEVAYGASFIEWFSEEAKRAYGDVIPSHQPGKRIIIIKQPVGVVGAVTPWNFPNAMITRKAGPAIAAGCSFVIKPASQTPLSALALAELSERAGIPRGVFNVVTGKNSQEIGAELTGNALIRKFTFTGSTAVGKQLMSQCTTTVKKVSMELGGNAPFIVFDDADLDAAVEGAMASKYRNSGQTCVCANRILVQDNVYEVFAAKLANAVSTLKVGDGIAEDTDQGPLIDAAAVEKVEILIANATNRGARIIVGGDRHKLGGTFFEPTLLTEVTRDMDIAHEEIFGPVAPLFKFKTEKEATEMANDTQYGLAAYFYARDAGRIWRVAESLDYGMVGINEGVISTEVAPFGGMKESGIGREGSKYGIDEYLEIKYLLMGGLETS